MSKGQNEQKDHTAKPTKITGKGNFLKPEAKRERQHLYPNNNICIAVQKHVQDLIEGCKYSFE